MAKIIAQGAEAIITLERENIIKNRIPKSYRLPELDKKIRESRTRKEAKILEKASKIINVPKLIFPHSGHDPSALILEFIDGDKLSETLNSYLLKKQLAIMELLGEEVAKLHKHDIIHGDLTTSNMILLKEKLYIIDFGLGFISKRNEDKAVDLHLIKQALEAKHFQHYAALFDIFLEGYQKNYPHSKEILERFKKVELRGRYKNGS